jgi:hypothetical protein
MAFWSNAATEPKRVFKFIANIQGLNATGGSSIEQWVLKKADRPNFKVGEQSINFLDKKFYYPTKVEWTAVKLSFQDPVAPSTTSLLYSYLLGAGYTPPNNFVPSVDNNGLNTISKQKAQISTIEIISLNSNSEILETWKLKNPFFTDVTFSANDYDGDGMHTVDVTVRYDWAEYVSGNIVTG